MNIDLTKLSPLEGNKKTTGNLALGRIIFEWAWPLEMFEALKNQFLVHKSLRGQTRDNVVAQVKECNNNMTELWSKSRLLASWIGKDERPD